MTTLTLIFAKTFPEISFYQSLLVALFIDLAVILTVLYLMEKKKRSMEIMHSGVIERYRNDQRQLEYKLKSYKAMAESTKQPKITMEELAEKQQEHEKILAGYIAKQEKHLMEIEDYRKRISEYEKKLADKNAKVSKGSKPIKNLEPLPPEIKR